MSQQKTEAMVVEVAGGEPGESGTGGHPPSLDLLWHSPVVDFVHKSLILTF